MRACVRTQTGMTLAFYLALFLLGGGYQMTAWARPEARELRNRPL